jgi:small conductance mechanosensitive channel
MLADFSCDTNLPFDPICRAISGHDPTHVAGPVTERIIDSIGLFLIIYLIGRLVRRVSDAAANRGVADRQVRTLIHNVVTVVTYVAATLSALVVAGVNFAVLVTAAGVGTVAIGLAFQDVLRNIFAGIWLLLERSFRLGDNITVADYSGVVQDITLRTTTLRTGDGRLAVLPNLTAFSNPVVNSSTYNLIQDVVSVRLPDDADLETAMRDARQVLDSVDSLAKKPAPTIRPQLDGEAVLLQCSYWLDHNSQDADVVAAEVARRLWKVGRTKVAPQEDA